MADGSLPLLATLRFAAFVALAIVGPGLGLQRLLRLRAEPALVLPVGLAWCALAHWLSLLAGQSLVFPVLCLPWLLLLAWRRAPPEGSPSGAPGPSLRGALLPLAVIVALFALTQYRVNAVDESGAFRLDVGEHVDTALHVGLSFELVHDYPPQVPGFAGAPLRYHVASHLVRAAAARWAGIQPYDALSRFDITLWALALVLALRAAAHAAGLGRAAVTLAGFAPLLCDLSWLPGLLTGSSWWAFKLGGNFLEPLFYANSIVPALAMALAVLVGLARAGRGEGERFTWIAAALAAATAFFKVFTGAQLALALGVAWLLGRDRRRVTPPLLAAGLALGALVLGSPPPPGVEGVSVRLLPFAPLQPALAAFGLPPAEGGRVAIAGVAWLLLSLGLRVLGLPGAIAALRRPHPAPVSLAVLALSGWPIALLLSITADPAFDESFYFLEASGLVLWLFVAPLLAAPEPDADARAGHASGPAQDHPGSANRARSAARALALAAAAVVTLAPAAEFVARKAVQPPERVPAAAVQAMRALRDASCPGDVVITRPQPREQWVPLPMVLAGRRVAFSNYLSYWRQFVTVDALAARDRQVRAFFRAGDGGTARAIAGELGAGYLYLTGAQQVDFESNGVLVPLFQEGSERVYRIDGVSRAGCGPN